MAEAPAPGWRPDPDRAGRLRWWNGLGWSDAYRTPEGRPVARSTAEAMREVAPALPDGPVRSAPGSASASRNPLARAALVLGALGVPLGAALAAIPVVGLVVALLALLRSRSVARAGGRSGLGEALAGLVLSLIGLARFLPALGDLLSRFAPG